MLIETKGITELGLTFGNSWQVIGVVIAGVMLMAFLANYTVQRWSMRRVEICYVLLLVRYWQGGSLPDAKGFHPTGRGALERQCCLRVRCSSPEWCFRFYCGRVAKFQESCRLISLVRCVVGYWSTTPCTSVFDRYT